MKGFTNMRTLWLALAIMAVITGCSGKKERPHTNILLTAQTEALASMILLTELRDGHLTNALELLEMRIDSSISMMDRPLSKASGPERDLALGALQTLKAYRERHPRRQEAIIPGVDTKEMTQEAARILGEVR